MFGGVFQWREREVCWKLGVRGEEPFYLDYVTEDFLPALEPLNSRVGLQNGDCRPSLYLLCSNKTAADIYIHPVCLLFIYFLTHQLLNTPLAE